jgi:iron complex outermembrane receptor protein
LAFNSAFSRNKIPVFDEFIDDWDTGMQKKVTHKNTDIAFSPNLIARGEVGFEVLKTTRQMLSVNLSGKYIGKQFLDNTSNDHTALEGFFYSNIRINYDLEKVIGERISFIFSVNNILDARYVSNGWAYRYISEGYDARPDDPYTRLEGNGVYHQAGYFPQAGRQWMLTANVRF